MKLHAVIISKDKYNLANAKREAKKFISDNKKYYRETTESYRFRNIPKTKFNYKTFITKKLNNGVSLVYGMLKK